MDLALPEDTPLHRRGYDPGDDRLFRGAGLRRLQEAQGDLQWLLDRGYAKTASLEIVSRHYQLAARQKTALQRSTDPASRYQNRSGKREDLSALCGKPLRIDGLNVLITLEVALSKSPVLFCRDGIYRDLAGLRGTYRLIPQTDLAIELVLTQLERMNTASACFFLDAPVSNSGRLKTRILEHLRDFKTPVEVELVHNADASLAGQAHVISGDSIVLDRCTSWFNLTSLIIRNHLTDAWVVDLSGL